MFQDAIPSLKFTKRIACVEPGNAKPPLKNQANITKNMSQSKLTIAAPELTEAQITKVNAALASLQTAKKSLQKATGLLEKRRAGLDAMQADLEAAKAKVKANSTNPADHAQYSALLGACGAAERGLDEASELLAKPTVELVNNIAAANTLLAALCADSIVKSIVSALRTALAPFYVDGGGPRGLMAPDAQTAFGKYIYPQNFENLEPAPLLNVAASRIEALTKLAAHAPDFFTFQGYDPEGQE